MTIMRNVKNQNLIFSIIVEKDRGGYFAECRELQGCYTQGKTYEEVMKNIKEVIELHIEDRLDRKDFKISCSGQNDVSLTTFSFPMPCHVS